MVVADRPSPRTESGDAPCAHAVSTVLQVILATGQGNVVYLEVSSAGIKEAGHAKIPAEVACVDITPLGEGPHAAAQLAVAGTWDQRLLLFKVPGLQQVQAEELGGQVTMSFDWSTWLPACASGRCCS